MTGGNHIDEAHSLQLSYTGDYYIVSGISDSIDIAGCINHGFSDLYIIKFDADIE